MNYGYIRVSTDKQTTKNQKFEIQNFVKRQNIKINEWIDETVSATKKLNERKFGQLLKKMEKGDQLVVTELSRLGRNLMQIMRILHDCMEKDIKVFTIKEGYELGDNINSKVLAFAFGLSAEIERKLISQRTKESLARLKAEGKILGRPKGSKKQFPKLLKHDAFIKCKILQGTKQIEIARELNVHRHTVKAWIEKMAQ